MEVKEGPPRPPSFRPPENLQAEIREMLSPPGVPHASDRVEATG